MYGPQVITSGNHTEIYCMCDYVNSCVNICQSVRGYYKFSLKIKTLLLKLKSPKFSSLFRKFRSLEFKKLFYLKNYRFSYSLILLQLRLFLFLKQDLLSSNFSYGVQKKPVPPGGKVYF